MRILYLCHRIPYPPNKGDKIRAFHQIRALAEKHELDLFTLADNPDDLAHREDLKQFCRELTVVKLPPRLARLKALPFLLTAKPITLPYFYSAELASAVRNALRTRQYDRIFVYCSAMAQYVESVDDIPRVVDFVDVDSDKWLQYAGFTKFPLSAIYRREGNALQRYERKIFGFASCIIVSTEREARLARRMAKSVAPEVVPNGVDIDYFDPSGLSPDRTIPTVIFTGDMAYFPNQQAVVFFAQHVLPKIRESIKDARFLIVGRSPGREVLKLQQISGVEVTGFVPDVRAYLAKAHVAVAPFSIAAGIQNKILEAMAFALPVVATSKTKQGLSRATSDLILTADDAEQMAGAVSEMLNDSECAARRGAEARARVAAEYQWESTLARMVNLVENAGRRPVLGPQVYGCHA